MGESPRFVAHGTWSTYSNYHCRCVPCKAEAARYRREWRRRHPSATQTSNTKNRARIRAALRVAKRYPTEFRVAIEHESAGDFQ